MLRRVLGVQIGNNNNNNNDDDDDNKLLYVGEYLCGFIYYCLI
jgi:hypothetical protein